VVAYVDLTTRRVTKVIDELDLAVPAERGEWDAEPHAVPARTDLKPIEITQPEGPSFSVDGNQIKWADWTFRFSFDVREGLTLHQISIGQRPVVYRASIAEMVVPYADASPVRYWQNYFDQGEYLFGRYTNSLTLGCDCLGEIKYFDVTIADERGEPRVLKNAICLHEEDFGVLWKHTDMFNGMAETRRSRRLVISLPELKLEQRTGETSVEHQRASVAPGRLIAGEEDCRRCNLLRTPITGLFSDHEVIKAPNLEAERLFEVALMGSDEIGVDESREQRVGSNAMEAEFGRQGLREAAYSSLGGGVAADQRRTGCPRNRGDGDDRSRSGFE
jgi:hypothetical protein